MNLSIVVNKRDLINIQPSSNSNSFLVTPPTLNRINKTFQQNSTSKNLVTSTIYTVVDKNLLHRISKLITYVLSESEREQYGFKIYIDFVYIFERLILFIKFY
jgi:hypothetical protein